MSRVFSNCFTKQHLLFHCLSFNGLFRTSKDILFSSPRSQTPGAKNYNFEWWKCFCTGSYLLGFSKDTKGVILDGNNKKPPPETSFTQNREFMHNKELQQMLWLGICLLITVLLTSVNSEKCSTISPRLTCSLPLCFAWQNCCFRRGIYCTVGVDCLSASPHSPCSSGLQDVWAETGRPQCSHAGEASAAPAGGPARRAWHRMIQRCGASCSRRRTGSVVAWSSSPQRWVQRLTKKEAENMCSVHYSCLFQ